MRIQSAAIVLIGVNLPDVASPDDTVIPEDASQAIVAMCKAFAHDRESAARYTRYLLFTVGTPAVNALSYEQVRIIVDAVCDGLEKERDSWCDECVKLEQDRLEAFGIPVTEG